MSSTLQVDQIENAAGTGGPSFPFGVVSRAPEVAVLTSGSGTYTTPVGATFLYVRMIGGGSGSGGSGSGGANGANGGNTTFGSAFLTAGGAVGGPGGGSSYIPSAGGTATGGDINVPGMIGDNIQGNYGTQTSTYGSAGANSQFGGGGTNGNNGPNPGTDGVGFGAGGGSPGGGGGTFATPGGSAGGYLEKLITSPLSTYAYSIGVGGGGGLAGSGGAAGAAGSGGVIHILAYF